MHSYTLPDLQNRYGMRKSALHKFLARHLGEINQHGQHALKTQNRWLFDDFAVSVLDRLRNFNQVIPADVATIETLNDTISNLQQQLIAAQNLNNRHQETISELKGQLIAELQEKAEIKDKLAAASFELLRIQANDKDTEKIQKENQRLQDNLTAEKKKSTQLDLQLKNLENENSILKKESQKSNINVLSSGWNRRFSPHYIKLVNVKKNPYF
jgi:DNA repair exonuclease SbcCD ATPase subunit